MTDTSQAPVETQPGLAATASRALGWSVLNTLVSKLGTLAIGVVLARALGPASFGTFAVATVALLAVLSFNELGVSLAIVRWREDPRSLAPTVTTISVAFSAVLLLAMLVSAPAFSRAMGDPGATSVVRLMAVSVLINGAVATPAALLQRSFQQKRRMVIDQVNTWLGAILSLALALAGFGAISLAIGRVAGSLAAAVLFIRSSPLPYRFGFDRRVARELLRFGLPLAGASIIVFAVGYVDQLSAGAVLGATALGFYVLAVNLSSWPVAILSQPLRNVAPATFARMQHDVDAMNEAFQSVAGLLAAVAVPVCCLIAGAADPLVRFVYGTEWTPAAAVLRFLGLLAVVRIFFELAYDYLVVRGRSRALMLVQGAWLTALVPTVILATRSFGLSGLAAGQVGVAALVVIPLYLLLLSRSGVRLGLLVRRLLLPLVGGALVMAAALVLSRVVASPFWSCAASGLVASVVVALLLLQDRTTIARFRVLSRAGA